MKGTRRRREEQIRELVWEWAPLGDDDPFDPHLSRDEYDWLVSGLEHELAQWGADAEKLAAYLTEAARSHYGIEPPPVDDVAERLAALLRGSEIWGVKVRMNDSASADAVVDWLRSEGHQARRQWGRSQLAVVAHHQREAETLASEIRKRWPRARLEVRGD